MMTGSIKDWPRMMQQTYEYVTLAQWKGPQLTYCSHLNPGGWIELLDPIPKVGCDDGSIPEDAAIVEWCRLLDEASTKNGTPLASILQCKQLLEDAGFINVQQVELRWPINDWPTDRRQKLIGECRPTPTPVVLMLTNGKGGWSYANMEEGVHPMGLKLFTQVLGWDLEDHDALVDRVRLNLANRDFHGYWPL
jgi:hypothetical protein